LSKKMRGESGGFADDWSTRYRTAPPGGPMTIGYWAASSIYEAEQDVAAVGVKKDLRRGVE